MDFLEARDPDVPSLRAPEGSILRKCSVTNFENETCANLNPHNTNLLTAQGHAHRFALSVPPSSNSS